MTNGGDDAVPAESLAAPFVGVDSGEWNDLLERGRTRGVLHAEEITHVLRQVEFLGQLGDGVAGHATKGVLHLAQHRQQLPPFAPVPLDDGPDGVAHRETSVPRRR